MNIPNVGAKVKVVTRYRNYYYLTAKDQPFVEFSHEGTVLPPMKGDKPGTFNITGNALMHSRNIAVQNVVKIEYIKGLGKDTKIRVFRVHSKSSNKTYTVTSDGTKFSCDCIGFQYRRTCKHVNAVKAKV